MADKKKATTPAVEVATEMLRQELVPDETKAPDPETKPAPSEPEVSSNEKAILDLVTLTESLDDEQKEALAQLGFMIPTGDVKSALRGEYEIGYWCPYCNGIALYFVGRTWNGTLYELKGTRTLREIPPLGVPIDKISWTQTGKKASEINRHMPCCQECGQVVQLQGGRCLKAAYLRDVKKFVAARDRSHDRREVLKLMSETGGAEAVGGLSSNYDNPKTVPSQFMTEQQKSDVTQLAHMYDPMSVVRK